MDEITLGLAGSGGLLVVGATWFVAKHMGVAKPSADGVNDAANFQYLRVLSTEHDTVWNDHAHLLVHLWVTLAGFVLFAAGLTYHTVNHADGMSTGYRWMYGCVVPLVTAAANALVQLGVFSSRQRAWLRVPYYLLLVCAYAMLGVSASQQRGMLYEALGMSGALLIPLCYSLLIETGHLRRWSLFILLRLGFTVGWGLLITAAIQEIHGDTSGFP